MSTQNSIPRYSLQSCCFSYPSGASLNNLNLNLAAGRFYGLIGPNGSGKTTLIDLLTATRKPDVGEVLLYGKPAHKHNKRHLAQHIALVPQSFTMEFKYTVFDIVMMGRHPYIPRFANPTRHDINTVTNALQTLDITHLKDRYITDLSGGERQRVIVARALAQDTGILVLDEATASLDIKHSIDIMTALRRRVSEHGVTVIAAIHDLDLAAAFCDELVVLNNGAIYAYGEVKCVLTPTLLEQVFHVKAEVFHLQNTTPHIRYRYRYAA